MVHDFPRNLARLVDPSSRPARGCWSARFRPWVEDLEERQLLATITDLGSVPYDLVTAINNRGQATGSFVPPDYVVAHAFLYDSAPPLIDLGTLPDGATSSGEAINDKGVVVGGASVPGGTASHAVITGCSSFCDLGTLGGGANSYPGFLTRGEERGCFGERKGFSASPLPFVPETAS